MPKKRITITSVEEEMYNLFKETCKQQSVEMSDVLKVYIQWHLEQYAKGAFDDK